MNLDENAQSFHPNHQYVDSMLTVSQRWMKTSKDGTILKGRVFEPLSYSILKGCQSHKGLFNTPSLVLPGNFK
jgi:hypothetical protein